MQKKTQFTLTALTGAVCFAASAVAHAQSSVTLYGIVDASVVYTNNQKGSSNVQVQSGKVNGSRWGLKGVEDLGGGTRAVFTLENGFRVNDGGLGQAGRLFGRQAFAGLAQDGIGTLTFGRQYEPLTDLVSAFAGSGIWSPATHIGDTDNLNQTFRINNAVKFRSDPIAGVTLEGMYAFSNQASGDAGQGFGNNRAWGVATSYTHGAFSAGVGYLLLNNPDASTNTAGAVGGASTANGDDYSGQFFYGIDGGVQRQSIIAGGAGYAFGATTIGFAYSHVLLDYRDGASRTFSNYDLNVRYAVTPALLLIGDYTFTDGRANSLPQTGGASLKPRWHQFTLAADYNLSKRTDVYLSGVYQMARGDASTSTGTGYAQIASIANIGTAASGRQQLAIMAGIRQRF
ncbi:porin [Paraburkholderia sp. J67]|uniref:porin n=1 Tax=Paraburkholderia sp. J67 TaxID=2805435 RepID=UPI002ABE02E6|nr:porin [Paraburkholderia sp. J67]